MAVEAIRFNKTKLNNLVSEKKPVLVKDTEERTLFFKVGKVRSVFQFEKRIAGNAGSPVTITIGAFPSLSVDEARQEARRLVTLCEKGLDPRKPVSASEGNGQPSLKMAIDRFYQVKTFGKAYMQETKRYVEKDIPDEWMDLPMDDITPNLINEAFCAVLGRSPHRAIAFYKFLKNLWNTTAANFCDKDGNTLIQRNPLVNLKKRVKYLKLPESRTTFVSKKQLGRFIVTLEQLIEGNLKLAGKTPTYCQKTMYEICLLTLFTGCRFNEIACLKWSYLDLDQGVIVLPANEKDGPFEGTKNRTEHWIPMASYPWQIFQRLRKERPESCCYVFPGRGKNTKNKPINRNKLAMKRLSEYLGFDYTPHGSRRSFGSIVNDMSINTITLKRLLNHKYKGDVTGRYIIAGFNPEKARVHFQRVCNYLLQHKAEYLGLSNEQDERTALVHEFVEKGLARGITPLDLMKALQNQYSLNVGTEVSCENNSANQSPPKKAVAEENRPGEALKLNNDLEELRKAAYEQGVKLGAEQSPPPDLEASIQTICQDLIKSHSNHQRVDDPNSASIIDQLTNAACDGYEASLESSLDETP